MNKNLLKLLVNTRSEAFMAIALAQSLGIRSYGGKMPGEHADIISREGYKSVLVNLEGRQIQGDGDINTSRAVIAKNLSEFARLLEEGLKVNARVDIPGSSYYAKLTTDGVKVGCTSVDKATLQKVNVMVFGGEARP